VRSGVATLGGQIEVSQGRYWEIDVARGVAVLLMVLFHYTFTLRYFGVLDVGGGWPYWVLFPRTIGSAFIVLSGVSLAISSGRSSWPVFVRRNVVRALKILSFALLITLTTFVLLPEGTIVFGILHLLGTSILLALPFVRHARACLVGGAMLFVLGLYLSRSSVDAPWLLWLGLRPRAFFTLDYYPLLPWFGLFLVAVAAGRALYSGEGRAFSTGAPKALARVVGWLGRHSLPIYLLHQPIFVALLYLLGFPILGEVRLPAS
jgi:uncharacterized membrane protein